MSSLEIFLLDEKNPTIPHIAVSEKFGLRTIFT
jgi:hypothetical protein